MPGRFYLERLLHGGRTPGITVPVTPTKCRRGLFDGNPWRDKSSLWVRTGLGGPNRESCHAPLGTLYRFMRKTSSHTPLGAVVLFYLSVDTLVE